MRSILLMSLFVILLFTAWENRVCPPEYYTWAYYDKNDPKQGEWAGSLYRYFIWVNEESIFVQSKSHQKGNELNEYGEIVDSISIDTTQFKSSLIAIESTPDFWKNKVFLDDSSRVKFVNLVSFPIEKTSLLSRRLPQREHRIEYLLDGRKHYVKLSMESSGKCVYDIRQYDATRFIMSIKGKIDEIKYGKSQHYVVMIDLEDLSRRRFLGVKL